MPYAKGKYGYFATGVPQQHQQYADRLCENCGVECRPGRKVWGLCPACKNYADRTGQSRPKHLWNRDIIRRRHEQSSNQGASRGDDRATDGRANPGPATQRPGRANSHSDSLPVDMGQ